MDRKKLLFIYNPYSGKGQIKNHLAEIIDIFVKAGYDATVYPTQGREDGLKKAQAEAGNFDRIVCSGGDGTLDEVMTGIVRSGIDVPIGYIPAGSTNDFANSLGIPKNMVKAAQAAVGDTLFACDIGDFNGATFVYVAAFGLFTEVSYQTSQQMKNILGHVAYIIEGMQHLVDVPSFNLRVEYDDQVIEDRFIYGMVTNSVSVGGFKGITGPKVKLDDGDFEVTLIKTPNNPIEFTEILTNLNNRVDNTNMIYTFKAKDLLITGNDAVSWTLDGEFGGEHRDLRIKNLQERVHIVVPKIPKASLEHKRLKEAEKAKETCEIIN